MFDVTRLLEMHLLTFYEIYISVSKITYLSAPGEMTSFQRSTDAIIHKHFMRA